MDSSGQHSGLLVRQSDTQRRRVRLDILDTEKIYTALEEAFREGSQNSADRLRPHCSRQRYVGCSRWT